jgi:hypothetical protein
MAHAMGYRSPAAPRLDHEYDDDVVEAILLIGAMITRDGSGSKYRRWSEVIGRIIRIYKIDPMKSFLS